MTKLSVDVVGDLIKVDAEARIRETRANTGHVWSVRFVHPDAPEIILFERHFNLTPMTDGEVTTTSMDEVLQVPLPEGTYKLEVSITRIPPNLGFFVFEDTATANRHKFMTASRFVTLER